MSVRAWFWFWFWLRVRTRNICYPFDALEDSLTLAGSGSPSGSLNRTRTCPASSRVATRTERDLHR